MPVKRLYGGLVVVWLATRVCGVDMEEDSWGLLEAIAFEVGSWLIGFVAGCAAGVRSVLGRVEIGEKN